MGRIQTQILRRIENNSEEIDFKFELMRKGIHFSSLLIPAIYFFISTADAIKVLSVLASVSFILDMARYFSPSIAKFIIAFFGKMLRSHEVDSKKRNLSGATYLLIAALTCLLIFPKFIAINALAIFILGDLVAALIGRRFGTYSFLKKSLEGTSAFFISSVILIFLIPRINTPQTTWLEYPIGIFCGFVGSIIENVSKGWADDNFSVPLITGAVMLLLYYYFFPGVELVYIHQPK